MTDQKPRKFTIGVILRVKSDEDIERLNEKILELGIEVLYVKRSSGCSRLEIRELI